MTSCIQEADTESNDSSKLTKHSKCTIIALYDNIQKESINADLLTSDSDALGQEAAKARKFCLYALGNEYNTTSCKSKGRVYWNQAKASANEDDKIRNYMKCYFITANFKCSANGNTGICTIQ